MTSKNIFLSEEGLRTLLKNSSASSLDEKSNTFGEDLLWSVNKKIELPIVLNDKGPASTPPITMIGIQYIHLFTFLLTWINYFTLQTLYMFTFIYLTNQIFIYFNFQNFSKQTVKDYILNLHF